MESLPIIASVMLVSGVVGGVANFFIAEPQTEPPLTCVKHVVIGIVAAFMVPLFLNMIAGDLIDKIRGVGGQAGDPSKLFVLSGFCLVAAVSSRAFMRTISDRVLKDISTAKQTAQEAKGQAAEAKAQATEVRDVVTPLVEEKEPGEHSSNTADLAPSPHVELNEHERTALRVMTSGNLSLRSLSGVAKDSSLEPARANQVISSLIAKGLAAQGSSSTGRPRWYATALGRHVAATANTA